jgi:hypothetical protein
MMRHMGATRRTFLGAVGLGLGAGALQGAAPWAARLVAADSRLAAEASAYVGLARPVRLLDTRGGLGAYATRLASGDVRLQVTGVAGIPSDARAVVATVTGVASQGPCYVTLWPSGGARPDVSNLNLDAVGEAVANLATVRVGAAGSLDVFSDRPAEIIVDVAGWYGAVSGPVRAGRSVLLDVPVRVLDTRPRGVPVAAGGSVEVLLPRSLPGDAAAVLVNLTAVGASGPGYVSTGPLADTSFPSTSNLNLNRAGETRAVAATVAVSTSPTGRGFRLWTTTGTHLLVDVMGTVTGPSAPEATTGLFVPVTPRRLLDTRAPGQAGRTWNSWLVECPVPDLAGTSVGGAVVNLTAVNARGAGYLSVLAARQPRAAYERVSHLNVDRRGQTASNHAVARLARSGGLSVHTSHGAHVLVDLAGYLLGTPVASMTARVVNPPVPVAAPPWVLEIPALRLRSQVFDGDPDQVTDAGHTWHWTGTGGLGQRAHVVLFAHRTEAGGPLRNLHRVGDGEVLIVHAGDGRVFTYRVVRREITDDKAENILAATRRLDGTTVSLVACSLRNGLPTSLAYRLVVTAQLEGVSDL